MSSGEKNKSHQPSPGTCWAAMCLIVAAITGLRHNWVALGLVVAVYIVSTLARWALFPGHRLPRYRTRHMHVRLWLRLHPGKGHATTWELSRRWGKRRIREAAMRYSRRPLGTPDAYSVNIAQAQHRRTLRISHEEHTLLMAPPRTGKTGELARIINHYPGAVLSTTSRADVFKLTSGIRSLIGPIEVFNPEGIGGVPSTIRWDPVKGCREPGTAIRRADAFAHAVSQKGVEGGNWFGQRAASYMRAMFCAADLSGRDIRTVAAWVFGADLDTALEILWRHGMQKFALELAQLKGEARKTIETIQSSMAQALQFVDDPRLMVCALPPREGQSFNIAEFLADCGTLYMIAGTDKEESPVAALFAAFTTEIHYVAGLVGSKSPAGRLDPPCLFGLDEVTQICPVPLPVWMADSGGKGVQVMAVAHGEAQLRERWDSDGAQIILDTTGCLMALPGITDPKTLEMISKLCGEAAYKEHGHDSHSRHDVMTPDMIRRLPPKHALIIRGGLSPVIGRLTMCWGDPLYRKAKRAGRDIAVVRAAETAEISAADRFCHLPSPFNIPTPGVPGAEGMEAAGDGEADGLVPADPEVWRRGAQPTGNHK